MSGPQSNFDKFREYMSGSSTQTDSGSPALNRWLGVLLGAAVGVVLGLLIGWVLWPVEWTNALPPDLSQEAKADYLSSVADAYVAARNQPAAAAAQSRLRYFGEPDQVAAEIEAAQAWLAETRARDAGLRINNMNELASALQLELAASPTLGDLPAPVDAAEAVPEQPGVDITPVADTAEPVSSEWGWARFLLVMVTGILLIAGGILVLRRLWSRGETGVGADAADADQRFPSDDDGDGEEVDGEEVEGFAEEESTSYGAGTTVAYDDTAREIDAYARERAGRRPAGAVQGPEGYAFAAEEPGAANAETVTVAVGTKGAPAAEDEWEDVDAEASEDDFGEDDFTEEDFAEEDFAEEDLTEEDFTEDVGADKAENEEAVADLVAPPAAAAAPRSRVATKTLGQYQVHYVHGDPDYDESFNILDAENGTYIGECGMGVNMKSGILQNNPENVVALDVWLFDKTDERRLETKTAILVTPQVIERDMAKIFGGDREAVQLIQPEPNMRFELEGGHLILECVVKQADFVTPDGGDDSAGDIFASLVLDMTVLRRR